MSHFVKHTLHAIKDGKFFKTTKTYLECKWQSVFDKESWAYILKHRKMALRETGMEALSQICQTFEKKNIKVFANFGTLLGLVRDGKFINNDSDIDMGIYLDDTITWSDVQTEMAGLGYELYRQFVSSGIVTEQTYRKGYLYIDFFAHHDEDNYTKAYCYYKLKGNTYLSENDFSAIELRMEPIQKIKKVQIDQYHFFIPDNAEKYLASIYTEMWRHPDPEWASEKSPAWNKLPNEIGKMELFE